MKQRLSLANSLRPMDFIVAIMLDNGDVSKEVLMFLIEAEKS